MTFGEFKARLGYLLAADTALARRDEAVKSFYKKAVMELISTAEPLTLITADRRRFTPHRLLDKVYFIRLPEFPATDESALDMDEFLLDAVLLLVASYMTRLANDINHAQKYEIQARIIIDKHMAETAQYIENIGYYNIPFMISGYIPNELPRTDIPPRLDALGLLKFYTVFRDLDRWKFEWDDSTVDILDRFMRDFNGKTLTPSTVVLFDQFCKWADDVDAGVSNDEEAPALEALDAIYKERAGI
jgi:hypothetical protein